MIHEERLPTKNYAQIKWEKFRELDGLDSFQNTIRKRRFVRDGSKNEMARRNHTRYKKFVLLIGIRGKYWTADSESELSLLSSCSIFWFILEFGIGKIKDKIRICELQNIVIKLGFILSNLRGLSRRWAICLTENEMVAMENWAIQRSVSDRMREKGSILDLCFNLCVRRDLSRLMEAGWWCHKDCHFGL